MIEMVGLDGFDVERTWEGAVLLLSRVGLQVENKSILGKIAPVLEVREGRALFTPEIAEHFAEEIRVKAGEVEHVPPGDQIAIHNIPLAFQYVEPSSGRCLELDTPTVLKYSRLIFRLAREGELLGPSLAGCPCDIDPSIRMLYHYYLECCHNPEPSVVSLAESLEEMRLVFEVSAIMGFEPKIGTQLVSPMKFVGGAQEIAVAMADANPRVVVDPMPILGVTAPLDWYGGWAQAIAEGLGSYILFRLCDLSKVDPPWFRLFLPNMATGYIYFSSPLHLQAMLTRRKVLNFFGLQSRASEMVLVSARRPNQCALVEKTVACLLAKTYGFTILTGAGNLFMDQIFSPQQLLIDIEIKNYVNSIAASFDQEPPPVEQIMAGVTEGVGQGGFLGADATLANLDRFTWRPHLFGLSASDASDWGDVLARANSIVESKIDKDSEDDYELTGERRRQLDDLMEEAIGLAADGRI